MGKVVKTIGKIFGGGAPKVQAPPPMPDYEAERKKAEDEALKKRQASLESGLNSAILGGSAGDETGIKKKKLLGE